jgi:hypothetical protein
VKKITFGENINVFTKLCTEGCEHWELSKLFHKLVLC